MGGRIVPLIMCGGAGTRLWPASREVRPKQFLPLFGTRSTFQDTILRVSEPALFDRPIVITNAAYRFVVLEQLAEIGIDADILLEPMRRDSGPAIAAGAAFARMRGEDAVVLALAADHVVRDNEAFISACREGLAAAEAGRIVTFGVQPERAATEYGYISPGEPVSGKVQAVKKFVEKPDPATAAEYVKAGYFWNSGNFMFRAAVLLDEYRALDAESIQAVSDAVSKDTGRKTPAPGTGGDQEPSWRERALNAEAALTTAHAEIAAQRRRMAILLGQIRDLEHDLSPEAAQRLATENTTLKQRVRQLTHDNKTLEDRLEAARSNNRFADRRIAQLEAQLLDHPAR